MTGETLFVFGLLLVTIILFVSDRLRLDVVAMLVIVALMLSGLLSPGEGLSAFISSTGTVAIFIPIALGLAGKVGVLLQLLAMVVTLLAVPFLFPLR